MILKQKNLIFILGLLGFLVSSYLFYIGIKNNSPFCFPDSSCDFVLKSKYSKFLGLPVALWGVFYFGGVLILNFFEKFKVLLKIVSSLGLIFALYLIYLQVFVLKSFCLYCLLADTSAILILILSLVKI
ncbi:Vitamin K epoxide reductase [bacterium HR35]|nr:Vitamin K epoxide reductase [bacterium HR35]